MPNPNQYRINDIRSKFQTVATTNHYQAFFEFNATIVKAATSLNLSSRFLTEDLGLYVSDAVLPGSSFADVEISGDRQGITERFPHTRIYDDVTFTFYVDRDYNVIKLFELWNEIISPVKAAETGSNANVMRLKYPEFYKCRMSIFKFNKDAFQVRSGSLAYTFINAWPYSIASIPVSYNGSTVLQLNVTFRYDRYVVHNITIAETPETILRQQQLWEENILNSTGAGDLPFVNSSSLSGTGTRQELYEINSGGAEGGPVRDIPLVPPLNPEGTPVIIPKAFRGNFGFGPGAA